ncbi:hypothetical protein AVEN_273683-1, partial [Araneus ventricosus]
FALPEETLRAWERCRSTKRKFIEDNSIEVRSADFITKSELDLILEFLENEVEAEKRIILAT